MNPDKRVSEVTVLHTHVIRNDNSFRRFDRWSSQLFLPLLEELLSVVSRCNIDLNGAMLDTETGSRLEHCKALLLKANEPNRLLLFLFSPSCDLRNSFLETAERLLSSFDLKLFRFILTEWESHPLLSSCLSLWKSVLYPITPLFLYRCMCSLSMFAGSRRVGRRSFFSPLHSTSTY